MIKKFSIFCILLFAFSIVFRGFSSLETGSGSGSGSGSMSAPQLIFKSWRIGRSERGTVKYNEKHCSFITSTGTTCRFEASVGYKDGISRENSSPIDPSTVTWSVYGGNQGIKLAPGTTLQGNWSGSHPNKLLGDTAFNVVGKLTLDAYKSTSTPDLCQDWNLHRRGERTPSHRDNTKLAFKIKFRAQTTAGQTVSDVLSLEAIEEDQIRQEYVDLNRPIPSRDSFQDSKNDGTYDYEDDSTYDFGHYKKMLNYSLKSNFKNWIAEINKLRSKKVAAFTIDDFVVTSGYRNPHHNKHHAKSGAKISPHMYGYALDVRGRELAGVNGRKLLDINGDGVNNDKDRARMIDAAKNAGARKYYTYPAKHVHADWAASNWASGPFTPGDPPTFSLPPAGTDNVACDKQKENSCDVMVSSSTEHYVTCPSSKCGDAYWSCDSDDYDEHRLRTCTWTKLSGGSYCGKSWRACEYDPEKIRGTQYSVRSPKCVTDPNGNRHCAEIGVDPAPPPTLDNHACGVHASTVAGDHSWVIPACGDITHGMYACQVGSDHSMTVSSCSETDSHGQYCTVTDFYVCQYHTHQYPTLISGACGHSYTASSSYSHRLESCPTNSHGDSCTIGSYYACQSHTHSYPAPTISCGRSVCQETVSSTNEHRATCVAGHLYWTCKPYDVHWHQLRTCKRSGCRQSWTLCRSAKPTCRVNSAWKCRAQW